MEDMSRNDGQGAGGMDEVKSTGEMGTLRIKERWGTWVDQSVKLLTLDFTSSHDLTVGVIEPHIGLCADGTSLLGILSLSPSSACTLSLSLSK